MSEAPKGLAGVQSSCLGTKTTLALYAEGQVTQGKRCRKEGMQGGNLRLWKSGCTSMFPTPFPGCPSTLLPHCRPREWWGLHPAKRRAFSPCLFEGQLRAEGGYLQSALAAHHPAFNRQGRTFSWTTFLKELPEDHEYGLIRCPLIQRGLISTSVEVSRWSDLCYIQCSLSNQVRMTPSGDRGKKGSTWISLEFPVMSLWT